MGRIIDKKASIEKFCNEWNAIASQYSKLSYEIRNGIPIIFGCLELTDEHKVVYDFYDIEIHWMQNYPYCFPFVYETGGRIPINIDWHRFESDGHCCIKTKPEEQLLCFKGITLDWFLSTQVIPYFFGQTFRRQNGYFLKERPHGIFGDIQFLSELLHAPNMYVLAKLISLALPNAEYKNTAKCFCGSGSKFKKCHKKYLRELGSLDKEYLHSFLISLNELIYLSQHFSSPKAV